MGALRGFIAASVPPLALYLITLCPDLYWYDSAELVNDAYLLDIPHPPGYPLFNLLAFLFTKLPVLTIPARVHLFSACAASVGVGFFYLALSELEVRPLMALAASWLLAVTVQYWELAVVAEVYSLEALLLGACFSRLALMESRGDARPLGLFAAMGLMLFHRPTVVVFLVPWLVLSFRRWSGSWRPCLVAAGCGALPYLHTAWVFFFRADPPGRSWSINYFDFPRTGETFFKICTGTLYASNLGPLSPAELITEVGAYLALLTDQLGVLLAAAALWGLVEAIRGRLPRACLYLAATVAGNVVFFLHYNALEKDTMYVPSFMALLALATVALSRAAAGTRAVVPVGLVLVSWTLWTAVANLPRVDRRDYHEVRRCVDSTARLLPLGSFLYLTDDLIIHPFLYVKTVENRRLDVTLQIVDGFGPEVEKGLRERLGKGAKVFSPLFYPEKTFARVASGFSLVPRGFLYEIFPGRVPALPRLSGPAERWDRIELVGAAVRPQPTRVRRSDQFQVVVTWQRHQQSDPAVVFSWRPSGGPTVEWAFPVGYQRRPPGPDGRELTEEYLLKVPWRLPGPRTGKGELRMTALPSLRNALDDRILRRVNTRDWEENRFFKGQVAGFVRCMERGHPACSDVLEPVGGDLAGRLAGQRWVVLGTLELIDGEVQ
ncbi:MAG: DUF2723 domain-containing protein [Candidatus Riflebacteria bacterium]|nr:DUF2723 domain-containing protein [Candidatus Riflebacteria bacterium]